MMRNPMDADCPCCAELGYLPHLPGQPGLVDNGVVLRMCDPCIDAAFLGGGPHPHPMDGLRRLAVEEAARHE